MVTKIYEKDIIEGINSIGMTSIAYIDDLYKYYNDLRVQKEKLTETEFMIILSAMQKRGTIILSRGRDVQLGHMGFMLDGNLYGAVVLILDKCEG